MKLAPERIAKNATYLTAAYVGQKLLAFVFFIAIARLTGVENTGKYFFAMSFATIFTIFADAGLSSVLTREVAKASSRAQELLAKTLGIKSLLFVITYGVMISLVYLLRYDALTIKLVYVAGLVMVLDSLNLTLYAVLRGKQNLKFEALGIFIAEVIIVGFGSLALWLGWPLTMIIVAFLLGGIFNTVYATVLLIVRYRVKPYFTYHYADNKKLLKIALPFALAGLFVKGYTHLDSVLLSKLADATAVGYYSIPFKITFALQFIPMAFAASIYPAMSNYFVNSKDLLAKTYERALYYLMIMAMPIAFGVLVLAEPFITLIYGEEYRPAILALQIMIFSVIFIFIQFPVGSLLNAANRQSTNSLMMGLAMVINIIANLILIPRLSFTGAAIANLLTLSFLFFSTFIAARSTVKIDLLRFTTRAVKILLSAVVMSTTLYFLQSWSLFILVPLGALIYFLVLFTVRGLTFVEIRKIFNAVFKRQVI